MAKQKLRCIVFGPPGSGKKSQAEAVSLAFGVPLLRIGAMLKEEVMQGTKLGELVDDCVRYGVLGPDEVVTAILARRVKKMDLSKGFVLEGFPRNIVQAQWLERELKPNLAVYLRMTDVQAKIRLRECRICRDCGKKTHGLDVRTATHEHCPDCTGPLERPKVDQEAIMNRRLHAYHFMTEPLANFYREKGTLLAVQADRPLADVTERLIQKVKRLGYLSYVTPQNTRRD